MTLAVQRIHKNRVEVMKVDAFLYILSRFGGCLGVNVPSDMRNMRRFRSSFTCRSLLSIHTLCSIR